MNEPDCDTQKAHRFFSAQCFNKAWDLIEKPDRSDEDNEMMILLCKASLWHWTQREDCTPINLSIGYWQASRIFALLKNAEQARHYGLLSLGKATEAEPFYRGYAYEALARAERVAGDDSKRQEYLAEARRLAALVSDAESQKLLVDDLNSL